MHIMNPPLLKFTGAAIPQQLKAMRRWAPWAAQYDPARQKYDKLPKNPHRPEFGISTASPEKWATFEQAVAAYTKAEGMLQGVGFVMTGRPGVVGVDLDNCVDQNGAVAPWAQEVVNTLHSYTEVSPSGRGLRIFLDAELDGPDWNNHEVGIEVYGGSSPRFLTVSGRALPNTPPTLSTATKLSLAGLRGMFGRASRSAQQKNTTPMPEVLPAEETPQLADVEIPPAARDFLENGEHSGDRSRALHSASVALFSAGLTPQQVLSVLVHSGHAFEVALDHRRQDADKALDFIWVHQCLAAQPKARPRALSAGDFDDLTAGLELPADAEGGSGGAMGGVPGAGGVEGGGAAPPEASGFDDVTGVKSAPGAKQASPERFKIYSADEYVERVSNLQWFVKGLLPKADIGAVFGESGSGKTFWTLDLVAHIAMGWEWNGMPTRQGRVLYIAAEGASGMRDRINAFCHANDADVAELGENFFALGGQPNFLEKKDLTELVGAARKACGTVDLIVVDTMAQVTPGANENSGEDMGRFLNNAKAIGKAFGAMVLLVGHSGKDSARGLRGWSGIKGALDAEIEVVKTSSYKAATVTKLKDGAGEGREYRFDLTSVCAGFAIDDEGGGGELVMSCAVTHGEVLNEGGARDVAAQERKEAAKEARAKDPRGRPLRALEYLRGHPDAAKGIPQDVVRAELGAVFAAAGLTNHQATKGKAKNLADDALERLKKRGSIKLENDNVYLIADSVAAPSDAPREI